MKIYLIHDNKKSRRRQRRCPARARSLARNTAAPYQSRRNYHTSRERLAAVRPTNSQSGALAPTKNSSDKHFQREAIQASTINRIMPQPRTAVSRILIASGTKERPPISKATLLSVMKGIWHLCTKCVHAGQQPCQEPICKAIHKLIKKISTHKCPKSSTVSASVPGALHVVRKISGSPSPPLGQNEVGAFNQCKECKCCDLWGYIMGSYLKAHSRASAPSAVLSAQHTHAHNGCGHIGGGMDLDLDL
jgi:hypothetical protein